MGYANFIVNNPSLKLVLLEEKQASERLNHLGVETFEQADVDQAIERFDRESIRLGEVESGKTCCCAKQNKVWSVDPQGMRWEWYRVLEDSETFGEDGFDTRAINYDKAQADTETVVCCN
ncbi:Cadmium-induced protein CadI [Piscirickettsia salmonis]|uniref:ArsI/CadI family heavy metal resistance metalloenzyme n=1 Tax=Piscirickettsia salmonis TaxID=1238 RepID=UPI0018ACB15A|nr:ArsI/CadI family heavy metal resistance metalloenzyme [Piscirickettsia salmonis]QGP55717.1 Cadmium-induced protein CadI [Piscirickettsia salmonis]QGP58417.1 Cadmium-induced protein CadI [Piscirickettsia salmonis]QGP65288.1 Cadmium-induced protein CadI [Piscirickettsia salmonis]